MVARLGLLAVVLAGCVAAPPVSAQIYWAPDVPTDYDSSTFLPWEIVRDDGSAAVELGLPNGTFVSALHRMDDGDWLLSVEVPTDLGGTTFRAPDVVRFDGISYSLFFDGAANGVPAWAGVDAVFLEAGDLVLSFDSPVTLAGTDYESADLVHWDGITFSVFLDASATTPAIPPEVNVVGAAPRGSDVVLTFDVPVTLGPGTFLPGDAVLWDGAAFSLYYGGAGWPVSSRLEGLSFTGSPGSIEATLRVDKSSLVAGDLSLSWDPSCLVDSDDYGIYEGQIGDWSSHTQIDCTDDGSDRIEEVTPGAGQRYYLVVPHNGNDEGSYGMESGGGERSRGTSVCVATQALGNCP